MNLKRFVGFAGILISALLGGAPASMPTAGTRTLIFQGPATNSTAEVSASLRIVLVIEGEKATATIKTELPLSGTGRLEGRFIGGWCELGGKVDEGFQLQFRGVINARDFRGTYIAAVPGQPIQYGKFQLTLESAGAVHSASEVKAASW